MKKRKIKPCDHSEVRNCSIGNENFRCAYFTNRSYSAEYNDGGCSLASQVIKEMIYLCHRKKKGLIRYMPLQFMRNREMPLQFSPFEKCHCNGIFRSLKVAFLEESWQLQWHFSKDENYSGISRFRMNCSGIYLINPILIAYDVYCCVHLDWAIVVN